MSLHPSSYPAPTPRESGVSSAPSVVVDRRDPVAAGVRLTERDVEILAWLAGVRCAMAPQIGRRFGMAYKRVSRRLGQLMRAGLLEHERLLYGKPGVYMATADGIAVGGKALPPARLDVATYRHDLALVDLAIDAELAGEQVVGQREMRAVDATRGGEGAPPRYAIELDDDGSSRRHFPDLIAGRQAVELELTDVSPGHLESVLGAYARGEHLAGVVYYVEHEELAARIRCIATELELGSRLKVQTWRPHADAPDDPWRIPATSRKS